MNYHNMRYAAVVISVVVGAGAGLPAMAQTLEGSFQGPPAGANPPTGGGLFSVNADRNIGFGSEGYTPANTLGGTAFGKVFMVSGANNPGVAVRNLTTNKKFILTADNEGRLTLFDDSVNAARFSVETNGDFLVRGTASLRATNVLGNVQATYVTAGVFGGGTGNFAFPAALGVGVTSIGGLPANGLHVQGQVRIAGGTPGAGKVLTASDNAGLATWQTLPVVSVFGRTGAITAGVGDYSVAQITGAAPSASPTFTGSVTMPGAGVWNSSGQVGIGTTPNANAKLHVYNGTGNAEIWLDTPNDQAITARATAIVNKRGGLNRWWVGANNNSGTDDYAFYRYNNDGTFAGTALVLQRASGNVGIGVNPSYKLDVAGGARFTGTVIAAPPTADNEVATRGYVNTLVSGGGGGGGTTVKAHSCDADATCEMTAANLQNGNISGVNLLSATTIDVQKLNVTTIDPIYTIEDVSYSTYVSDTIGLKMEAYGKATLERNKKQETINKTQDTHTYEYVIDFKKVEKGSDLWLFWQTIDEGRDMADVIVNLTPEFDGRVWYELKPEEKQIIIHGTKGGAVSYHLVAPRHDAKEWPQILDNPRNKGTALKIRN